jgi:hypothetical protein
MPLRMPTNYAQKRRIGSIIGLVERPLDLVVVAPPDKI